MSCQHTAVASTTAITNLVEGLVHDFQLTVQKALVLGKKGWWTVEDGVWLKGGWWWQVARLSGLRARLFGKLWRSPKAIRNLIWKQLALSSDYSDSIVLFSSQDRFV